MATVTTSTNLWRSLDQLGIRADNGDFDLEGRHQAAIARFQDSILPQVEPTLVTLNSNRIEFRFNAPSGPAADYRFILAGSGIGPVNSIEALEDAIGNGIASGGLSNVSLTANGTTLFSLALAPSGYTYTSGVDVVKLNGSMPTTFAQLTNLAGLLGELDVYNIAAMTAPVRSAYFNDLANFGITGFSVGTGASTFLSLAITATSATLRMGDLKITLLGTLPDDFGAIASTLYDVSQKFGQNDPIDLSQLPGLGINRLTITDATNAELLLLTGPVTDGQIASNTVTGTAGADIADLADMPFANANAIFVNMLGGDDTVTFNTYDLFQNGLNGGVSLQDQPQYTIDGGAGVDRLHVQNYAYQSSAVVDLAAGTLQGFATSGTPNALYNAQISNFQQVLLEGTDIVVRGGAGNDTAIVSNNYWGSSISFSGGAGTDTLDLRGVAVDSQFQSAFNGISRAMLDNYEFRTNPDGSVSMISQANYNGQPNLELNSVENLIVLRNGSTTLVDTVSVSALANAVYAQKGTAAADNLTGNWKNDVFYGDGYRAVYDMDEAKAVYRLYQATLDRAPDTAGLADWTERLANGSRSLGEVATGFVNSTEFQSTYKGLSNGGFVELLYQNVLNRAADAGGLADWTGRLDAGTFTKAQVVTGFSQSNEFRLATDTAATRLVQERDAAFWTDDVYRLYQATLDRAPDAAGHADWANKLANGTPFLTAVAGFVNSTEFQTKYNSLSNSAFVELLYQNVLDRAADAGGLADWVSRLEAGTYSRAAVVQGFSQSAEFVTATKPDLIDWVRAQGVQDVLDAGGGTNKVWGGTMSDQFVFNNNSGGTTHVMDFEAWDYLNFQGFGHVIASDVLADFTQSGADVVFSEMGTTVIIANTLLSQITEDNILM